MLIRIDYLMSTQTDKVRQKKCPECKKRIDIPNYDVHLQKCIETRSQLSSNSSMSNVSLQNGERTKGKRKYVEKVEYFPCHLCGFNQTMMDLDTHPRICPNKEINCPQCHLNFPSNILPAHKQACSRLVQPQRPPLQGPKPLFTNSNLISPQVPNYQDKQLVVNKQTSNQNLFGNGNKPTNNQTNYVMNLPPAPKPEIFPHQQTIQIAPNVNNNQANLQKKAEIKKVVEKIPINTVTIVSSNQQQKGQVPLKAVNNHQMKSTSQKLEKANVEPEKKGPSSQALPNTKPQSVNTTQTISNNAPIAPKNINPFKSNVVPPANPIKTNQPPPNSNAISQNNIHPAQLNLKPKQNASNTTSNNVFVSNAIPPKNNQNTVPNNPIPQKVNPVIPANNTSINSSTRPQNPPTNPSNTNQPIPRSTQTNPPVNPFKNNAPSNQVVNLFVAPRNPPLSSSSSNSNNITSMTASSQYTSTSLSSNNSSSLFVPVREQNGSRISSLEARSMMRGVQQYFNDMQLDRIVDRNLINLLSSRLSDGKSDGLSETLIKTIPEVLFTTQMTKGQTESCSICFVQFQKNERLKNLRCRHLFHSKCISQWLRINRLCPLCKTDLSENIPSEFRQTPAEEGLDRLRYLYLLAIVDEIYPFSDDDDYDQEYD